jgi:hypothetical protein
MALSWRTVVAPVGISSGTAKNTGQTVAVGDFAIATLAKAGTAANELVSVTGFTDSVGNTWTQLGSVRQNSSGSASASIAVFTSVITNAASGNLTITATYTATAGACAIGVDVITGFAGTATLDPGGATAATTGSGTTAMNLPVNVLGSGTGVQAVEMSYVIVAGGGGFGVTGGATTSGLTGTLTTLQYNASDAITSYGFLTSVAPTSSSTITPSWTNSHVALGVGLTVYDTGAGGGASIQGVGFPIEVVPGPNTTVTVPAGLTTTGGSPPIEIVPGPNTTVTVSAGLTGVGTRIEVIPGTNTAVTVPAGLTAIGTRIEVIRGTPLVGIGVAVQGVGGRIDVVPGTNTTVTVPAGLTGVGGRVEVITGSHITVGIGVNITDVGGRIEVIPGKATVVTAGNTIITAGRVVIEAIPGTRITASAVGSPAIIVFSQIRVLTVGAQTRVLTVYAEELT